MYNMQWSSKVEVVSPKHWLWRGSEKITQNKQWLKEIEVSTRADSPNKTLFWILAQDVWLGKILHANYNLMCHPHTGLPELLLFLVLLLSKSNSSLWTHYLLQGPGRLLKLAELNNTQNAPSHNGLYFGAITTNTESNALQAEKIWANCGDHLRKNSN